MAIIFLRTIIIYLLLVFSMRLMGKRQLGELELSEFVVSVLIADLAANPLQDTGMPLLYGLIPVVTLLCCELIISACILKSVWARKLLCGTPSMLIIAGQVNQKEMRKNRFTLDELTEELRGQGVTDISKVQYAILETDGTLNTILFPADRPVTAGQLGLTEQNTGYPTILINDGVVLDDNLRHMGRDRRWLEKELRKRGIAQVSQVYLMTLNDAGQIYFSEKERGDS